MRNIYHESGRLAAWAFLILPGIVTPGCDRPVALHPTVPTERQSSSSSRMSTTYSNPGQLPRHHKVVRPGLRTIKQALLAYPAYRYEGKPPVQSGDSATVTVIVKDAKTGIPRARCMVDDEGQRQVEAQGRPVAG